MAGKRKTLRLPEEHMCFQKSTDLSVFPHRSHFPQTPYHHHCCPILLPLLRHSAQDQPHHSSPALTHSGEGRITCHNSLQPSPHSASFAAPLTHSVFIRPPLLPYQRKTSLLVTQLPKSRFQSLSSSTKLWVRATVHLTSPTELPGRNRVTHTVLDTTLQHNPRKLLSMTSLIDSLPHSTLEWTMAWHGILLHCSALLCRTKVPGCRSVSDLWSSVGSDPFCS